MEKSERKEEIHTFREERREGGKGRKERRREREKRKKEINQKSPLVRKLPDSMVAKEAKSGA